MRLLSNIVYARKQNLPAFLKFIYFSLSFMIMDHILARLKGVKLEDIKGVLKADAPKHAEHGLILRHLWRNADDPNEILFIFTAADLDRARKFIETMHVQARKENANANLPELVFLKGE
jgi:hypothetical protein